MIVVGERYLEASGLWDAWARFRRCLGCAEQAEELERHLVPGECVAFGELADMLIDLAVALDP